MWLRFLGQESPGGRGNGYPLIVFFGRKFHRQRSLAVPLWSAEVRHDWAHTHREHQKTLATGWATDCWREDRGFCPHPATELSEALEKYADWPRTRGPEENNIFRPRKRKSRLGMRPINLYLQPVVTYTRLVQNACNSFRKLSQEFCRSLWVCIHLTFRRDSLTWEDAFPVLSQWEETSWGIPSLSLIHH